MAQESISKTASYEPDTTTLDEAMCQYDREELIKDMKNKLEDHLNRKHWKLIPFK